METAPALPVYGETADKSVFIPLVAYDPWGRTRNALTWAYNNPQPLSLIYRGFTGHEMLPEFQLINMNGRMYDPILGSMLSPDNYVQNPYGTQGFNRYSYAGNNPLKFIDPTGNSFLDIIEKSLDYFFIHIRLITESIMWFNDKINGVQRSEGYYFNKEYIIENKGHPGNRPVIDETFLEFNLSRGSRNASGFTDASGKEYEIGYQVIEWDPLTATWDPNEGSGGSYTYGTGGEYIKPYFKEVSSENNDYRADLLTTTNPIVDIFNAMHKAQSNNKLSNLYDVIKPNYYGSGYFNNYSKVLTMQGNSFKIRVGGYNKYENLSYYDIHQMGFGYLDRFSKRPQLKGYDEGYSIGFFMIGYERNNLITIGANTNEGYQYLLNLYKK